MMPEPGPDDRRTVVVRPQLFPRSSQDCGTLAAGAVTEPAGGYGKVATAPGNSGRLSWMCRASCGPPASIRIQAVNVNQWLLLLKVLGSARMPLTVICC